ncbi:MAG TPA: hypothetical protein PKC43_09980 [Phycisphaerales bacterium]|nr:hypothetical protein [Phycisphaerales bacterium]HMP37763.1 hypothetical protein [Phycisphaerales bacterium]
MRWSVFLVAALLVTALDGSLMGLFSVGGTAPSLAPLLVVFVAMHAPRPTAMWAGMLVGLLADLSTPLVDGTLRPIHLIGPAALGYLFAVNLVLPLRSMVLRRNPLTLVVLVALASFGCGLVITAIWTARSLLGESIDPFGGRSAAGELALVSLRGALSGAAALPMGWLLMKSAPIWGFQSGGSRMMRW